MRRLLVLHTKEKNLIKIKKKIDNEIVIKNNNIFHLNFESLYCKEKYKITAKILDK